MSSYEDNAHGAAVMGVRHSGGSGWSLPTVAEYEGLSRIASVMLNAGFLPSSIKTSEQALAVFFMGRAVGWNPFVALQFIDVIEGKPWVKPRGMLALAYQKIPGFKFEVLEHDVFHCKVRATRNGVSVESEFTMADAEAAGLTAASRNGRPSNYIKYPKPMLLNRATGHALASIAPDVISEVPAGRVFGVDGSGEEPEDHEPSDSVAVVVEDASARIAAAVVGTVVIPKPKTLPDDKTEHDDFVEFAKQLGFKTTKEKQIELVKNLGFPVGTSMQTMPPGTWRNALAALRAKYPGALKPADRSPVAHDPIMSAEMKTGPMEDAPEPEAEPEAEQEPVSHTVITSVKGLLSAMLKSLKAMAKDPKRNFIVEWPEGSGDEWVVSPALMESAGLPKERVRIAELTDEHAQRLLDAADVEARKLGGR